MPLSKAAQAALDIAAKRAARVASRDAGWGEFDPPSVEPKPLSEKKKKALEDAKEKSRCPATKPASTKALEARVAEVKEKSQGQGHKKQMKIEKKTSNVSVDAGHPLKKEMKMKIEKKSSNASVGQSPPPVTPPARVKRRRSKTIREGEADESAPKLPRRVQSKEILQAGRSPTLHYSPEGKNETAKNQDNQKTAEDQDNQKTAENQDNQKPAEDQDNQKPAEDQDNQRRANKAKGPKPTAAKAKVTKSKAKSAKQPKTAASPPVPPKDEPPTPATASAVAAALSRQCTADLAKNNTGKGSTSSDSDSGSEENENMDEEGDKELSLEQLKAKKAAHARYMRFSRSLKSKRRAPPEIRKAGRSAKRCSEKLGVLFEQWLQCEGHWSQSTLYQELKVSVRKRRLGARKWLTEPELIAKYQSARVATRIIESKLNDKELGKTQVRFHPDAPDDDECRQFLVWDVDAIEDCHDEITSSIFSAVDDDSKDPKGASESKQKKAKKKKNKKGKKSKKKKSSSSESQSGSDSEPSDSSSDGSSSSSDKKKKKKTKNVRKKKKSSTSSSGSRGGKPRNGKKPKKETEAQKAKREQKEKEDKEKQDKKDQEEKENKEKKELEAKAKQERNKRAAAANKVVTKLQAAVQKASLMQVKADGMPKSIGQSFLSELGPYKKDLEGRREALQKAVAAVKGGADEPDLPSLESDGENAVKNFHNFLSSSNMK